MKKILALLLSFISVFSVLLCGCEKKETEEAVLPSFRSLTWACNTVLPGASAFLSSDGDGWTISYETEPKFSSLGDHIVSLSCVKGQTEKTVSVHLILVDDTESPVIQCEEAFSVVLGDGFSYRNAVSVTDNCDNPVTLKWVSDADLTTEGTYSVTYTATDTAGNRTMKTIPLTVYAEAVTLEMLNDKVDALIAEYDILNADSIEAQCRLIYNWIHTNISYLDTSDKSDWIRAAYVGICDRAGDCYTYFAISKAFFERLSIENLQVKRRDDIAEKANERHYWNLVNIGTKSNPRWYHFDATRLRNQDRMEVSSGCLLTDEQLESINSYRVSANGTSNYFYIYDDENLPVRQTEVITH